MIKTHRYEYPFLLFHVHYVSFSISHWMRHFEFFCIGFHFWEIRGQMHLNCNEETYDLSNSTWHNYGIISDLKYQAIILYPSYRFHIKIKWVYNCSEFAFPLHSAFGCTYVLECHLRSEASRKCKANNWKLWKEWGFNMICICKSWNYVRFCVVIWCAHCSLFTVHIAQANDFMWTLTFHWILCRNEMPNNG